MRIAFRNITLLTFMLLLHASASAQQPASPQRIAGIINIEWGDPHPDLQSGGIAVAWLERPDLSTAPPEFAGRAITNPCPATRANDPFVLDVEEIEEPVTSARAK
jgi:hypothetical protein